MASQPERLDELYRPSLQSDDEFVHEGPAPWRPNSILVASFFGGPVTAAILFGWNARRLGRPNQTLLLLVAGFNFAVLMAVVTTLLVTQGVIDFEDDGPLIRTTHRVVVVGVGLIVARTQERRFRMFEDRVGDPASLWIPGLAALLVGWAVQGGIWYVVVLSFAYFGVGAGLAPGVEP